ncbi:hypothetical protein HX062_15955, partial [Myroides sp. DF42-4-2]|nr:hypothetical protein [Myroides sp. DF42-4-2]
SSDKVGSNRGFVAIPEEGDQVMISFVGNHPDRLFVMETLLYMGCKYADNADNADEIVVKVFEYIRTLNVERARIKGAMGYWRNTSSLHAYGMFKFRGVRYLLKVGEARCGEWSDFLMDICKIQSTKLFKGKLFMLIIKPKKDENDSLMYKNCAMLVKEWRIQDPLAPEDIKQRAQDLMNIPLGLFGDHVFVLYNTNYYDPSYGVFSTKGYESSDKLLHDYTNEALSGVLSISNSPNYPLIEAIKYKPLNGVYIDPCDLNTRIPSKCQYKFKTITYNMEKELTGGFYEVF